MKFSLIICTYQRPVSLIRLLTSVEKQQCYPTEIVIVDGSFDDATEKIFKDKSFENLQYFKVSEQQRGLTKQRNFGIEKASSESEVICFLDDDTILEPDYFKEIITTFKLSADIIGVGGFATNENKWIKKDKTKSYDKNKFYEFEGYIYPEASRNRLRNFFKLQSNMGPGRMPEFSHGRTTGFPMTGRIYEVDLLIGMSFSFRTIIFKTIYFSEYFEGYGLYEDADFSIRALKFGKNVINTKAKLAHYHATEGRPNKYDYGKMVVRNGYYVWRVKYPKPSLKVKIKWHAITLLLTAIRYTNILDRSSVKRKEAFTEALGRTVGWVSLIFKKPKLTTK